MKKQITNQNLKNLTELIKYRRELDKTIEQMYEVFCSEIGVKPKDFDDKNEGFVFDLFYDNVYSNKSAQATIKEFLKKHNITVTKGEQ